MNRWLAIERDTPAWQGDFLEVTSYGGPAELVQLGVRLPAGRGWGSVVCRREC